MEPGGLMPHSKGLSNNPYSEKQSTQFLALIRIALRSIRILASHLCLGLPKGVGQEWSSNLRIWRKANNLTTT